jgi:hypothetical protein
VRTALGLRCDMVSSWPHRYRRRLHHKESLQAVDRCTCPMTGSVGGERCILSGETERRISNWTAPSIGNDTGAPAGPDARRRGTDWQVVSSSTTSLAVAASAMSGISDTGGGDVHSNVVKRTVDVNPSTWGSTAWTCESRHSLAAFRGHRVCSPPLLHPLPLLLRQLTDMAGTAITLLSLETLYLPHRRQDYGGHSNTSV